MYDSTITFTLDTICPWTYLAKKRLSKGLSQFREAHPDAPIKYTVKYEPFQLYPEASQEGESKYAWYKVRSTPSPTALFQNLISKQKSRYGDSDEKMDMYTKIMSAYGRAEGIDFKFGGIVANTLPAHRLIQYYQETRGPETADAIINSLYSQYFEHERHPSAPETLIKAAVDAGVPEEDAKKFVESDEYEMEVKMAIREQAANGVDAVPFVVIEGRKRDVTLTGAKEVQQYVKSLEQVMKEST